MEQENLIKQQQQLTEQRKISERQNRLKTSSTFKEDEPLRVTTKESMRDSAAKIPPQNQDKSNKKALKKTKTEKIELDDTPKDGDA
mgnify:CR=1 FL=1